MHTVASGIFLLSIVFLEGLEPSKYMKQFQQLLSLELVCVARMPLHYVCYYHILMYVFNTCVYIKVGIL